MMKFKKVLFFIKVGSICVGICFILNTVAYSTATLRPNSMFDKVNEAGDRDRGQKILSIAAEDQSILSNGDVTELRPIEQLTWEDKEEVLGYFKALCAILKWPLPRIVIKDGEVVESFSSLKVKPLNIESLKKLAEGRSPAEYYGYLLTAGALAGRYFLVVPFLKEFGIWARANFWFRYHEQLENIKHYIELLPEDKPARILVHAAWHGEDAYAIAIMLNYFFKGRYFEIVGEDIVVPIPTELNWCAAERMPEFIKDVAYIYFTYKTPKVIALKDEFLNLVTLRQGDIRDIASFGRDLDIVVANNVLGQTVSIDEDIKKSVQNAWASLKAGGRFYVDNGSYDNDSQRVKFEKIIKKYFIRRGKFVRISDGVYEKIATGVGLRSTILKLIQRVVRTGN